MQYANETSAKLGRRSPRTPARQRRGRRPSIRITHFISIWERSISIVGDRGSITPRRAVKWPLCVCMHVGNGPQSPLWPFHGPTMAPRPECAPNRKLIGASLTCRRGKLTKGTEIGKPGWWIP
ncbi:hypothetical protein DPEC_G00350500 [Dallia pectoralis]|uniref:Uncharacterized protein n=1 Tax=Dallia pectoralis TaxID=75939 RepID=A0ACC2F1S0_DALPE|nr:hypothetical protein DPEC_G00350500 [Dallia pectoralis]